MEDLEKEVTQVADSNVPPTQDEDVSENNDTDSQKEELSDEELKSEVARLKEEAKTTEDPKEKRHLEQQAGRLQQLSKAREKANLAEQTLREKEERISRLEGKELEILFQKTQTEDWLQFFEDLYESDPETAEKLARQKYDWMSAKELIAKTYKSLAKDWNDDAKKRVSEEESEAKAEHKVAIKYASKIFSDLSAEEKQTAQKYFDRIAWKGYLTVDEAEEFADMAKHYATRGRTPPPTSVEKEKILAKNASTVSGNTKESKGESEESLVKRFVTMWYPQWKAELMAKTDPSQLQ